MTLSPHGDSLYRPGGREANNRYNNRDFFEPDFLRSDPEEADRLKEDVVSSQSSVVSDWEKLDISSRRKELDGENTAEELQPCVRGTGQVTTLAIHIVIGIIL